MEFLLSCQPRGGRQAPSGAASGRVTEPPIPAGRRSIRSVTSGRPAQSQEYLIRPGNDLAHFPGRHKPLVDLAYLAGSRDIWQLHGKIPSLDRHPKLVVTACERMADIRASCASHVTQEEEPCYRLTIGSEVWSQRPRPATACASELSPGVHVPICPVCPTLQNFAPYPCYPRWSHSAHRGAAEWSLAGGDVMSSRAHPGCQYGHASREIFIE